MELLPYLDEGNYRDLRANPGAAWWEPDNLAVAQIVVPHFLARTRPEHPGQVQYGATKELLGGNNFVGMAGLGLDAAEYRADDPVVAKKLGIFGYERVTKAADVRSLDKTIVLLQLPTNRPTPWIAGGGATVRGISDEPDDPSLVRPFVSLQADGREGTIAIMGDFKVRFIPKAIPNEVFRQLCTINGEKPAGSLDSIAPVIPPPESTSELKTQALPAGNP